MDRIRVVLWNLFAAIAALFTMINIHELGHVVTARVLGDSSASYQLYHESPDGTVSIGYTSINDRMLNARDLIAVNAGGVLITAIVAVAAHLALRRDLSKVLRSLLTWLLFTCLLDAGYQAYQGLTTSIPPQRFPTGIDGVDFAHLLGGQLGYSPRTISWSVVAAAAVWIFGHAVARWKNHKRRLSTRQRGSSTRPCQQPPAGQTRGFQGQNMMR